MLLPCVVEVILSYLLVGVLPSEPQLHAATRGFQFGGIKVGVGPDLFTHGLWCGINIGPLLALAATGAAVCTCRRQRGITQCGNENEKKSTFCKGVNKVVMVNVVSFHQFVLHRRQ